MKIAKEIAEYWCYDDLEKESLEAFIAEKLEPVKYAVEMAVLSQGWDANDPDEDRWTDLYCAQRDALAMFEEE